MKKGFILIELLAVIVILAIIALIATPIVLNIINETKESANLRSAEMYLDAVEQSMARGMLQNKYISDGTYNISSNGDICLNENCSETLKVEVEGEKPNKGNISIINGSIDGASIELNNKTLGISGNGGVAPVCILSSDSTVKGTNLGAKYECEVRPGTKNIFFVLGTNSDGSINLIMDSNINDKGVAIKSNDVTGVKSVEWINETDYNKSGGLGSYADLSGFGDTEHYGPVTAMNFIYNATKDWINIPNMVINYTSNKAGEIYSLQTNKNEVKIISKYGNETASYINLKARLPKITEVEGVEKCASAINNIYESLGSCPLWLVNYMSESEHYSTASGKVNISGVYGYSVLDVEACPTQLGVSYDGYTGTEAVCGFGRSDGIRPVITVKL